MNTPIDKQAEILAQLWMDYRDEEYFKDFFEYADLGFPLAYLISTNVVTRNPETVITKATSFGVIPFI